MKHVLAGTAALLCALLGSTACKEEQQGAATRKFAAAQRAPEPPAPPPTPPPRPSKKDDEDDDGKKKPKPPKPSVVDEGTIEVEPNIRSQPLVITGLRRDEGATIEILRDDGSTSPYAWPAAGAQIVVENACVSGGTTTTLRLQVRGRGGVHLPSAPKCFVGLQQQPNQIVMGFEADCDSLSFTAIDDLIATFTCPEGTLVIEALRLDPTINLGNWLD